MDVFCLIVVFFRVWVVFGVEVRGRLSFGVGWVMWEGFFSCDILDRGFFKILYFFGMMVFGKVFIL